jgi:ribosomal protein S12 methylthiotransferase accessory factor
LGRDLWVLDLTADLGVPVMGAVSCRNDGTAPRICLGFGAHFDPRTALRRAVTEMAQLLPPPDPDGGRGDESAPLPPELDSWWSEATIRNQPYLAPDPAESPRTPDRYVYEPQDDLLSDLTLAEDLLKARDLELLVLDQTRPDLQLPVVKVIVPGMRSFWARFAPGRLFDVPAALGRVPRPTHYGELNPIPLFV